MFPKSLNIIPHHYDNISTTHTAHSTLQHPKYTPHISHPHPLRTAHTHHAPHTSRTLLARAGERRRGRARSRSQITTRRLSFASLRLDAWYQRRQRRQRRRRMRRRCCRRRVAFLRQHRHVLNVRVNREERVVARRVSPATPHLCVVPRGVRGYTYGTPAKGAVYLQYVCGAQRQDALRLWYTSTEGARSRIVRA